MEFTRSAVSALTVALSILILPVYSQISTPCSPSMISSFTPCLNFVTNSTGSGASSPTQGCCTSLASLTSNGTDCLCLIVTGNVPFQLPINRSLAISLPRACRMPGVPLQCKAASAPIPAPGPAALGPSTNLPAPSASPQGSTESLPLTPTASPDADSTPDLTPPSTTTGGNGVDPTTNSGSRPVLTPSAASPSYSFSPLFLLVVVGAALLKYY